MATATMTTGAQATSRRGIRSWVWPWQLVSVVVAIALWALAVQTGIAPRSAFSTPTVVAQWLGGWLTDGTAWTDIKATLFAALGGYVIGIVAGLLAASLFAFVPGVAAVLEPYMSLLNSIPLIVIAPLFLLVLGIGVASKLALAAIIVFFLAFFSLYNGFRSVDRNLINHARVLGAGPIRLATVVYLPAVLSWVLTTMRVGIGFAFIGVVVGEFVGGNQGIGVEINLGQQLDKADQTVGGIVALIVIAAVLDWLIAKIESRFAQWQVF
ncbi:MAG TPA: ABC transporter permease [Pseudonocardiaceae bacterium]|nr:ABC transporter permease [Pseudonocardiaceae bacterium]